MISGAVNANDEAIVPLVVFDADGREHELQVINGPCQGVVNLRVPWHRLSLSCSRVAVNIVSGTVTVQHTAGLCKPANKDTALHTVISLT